VAILLPVYNEIAEIEACLQSLVTQEYPGRMEIIVAEGGSTDGTSEVIERMSAADPRIRLIPNPARVQSQGLNRAAAATDAEILVRADAHTAYFPDYVSQSVEALSEEGVDAAGGPMIPAAQTPFGRAVAVAFRNPLGVGPAVFHHAGARREADTVYLGAFRRDTFASLGGIRTLPSGVAEDADFYYRLRRRGGRVVVDPSIRTTYRPRETPGRLWRQFYRYGHGKADMLHVNGELPSWRPLAPLLLVLGLAAGLVVGLVGYWWPLAALGGLWLGTLAVAGRLRPLVVAAMAIMHLSFGIGMLRGLLQRPSKVRASVS
jgi:succinoglycan biosynthesis protein ExoA